MSRTDKTIPYRVLEAQFGTEYHDHRNGVCDIESYSRTPGTYLTQRHYSRCAKRVEFTFTCRHKVGNSTCLTTEVDVDGVTRYVGTCRESYSMYFTPRDHERTAAYRDDSIPCSCDALSKTPFYGVGTCGYHAPRAYVHPAGRSTGAYSCGCCEPIDRSVTRRYVRQRLGTLRGPIDEEMLDDFDLGV